MKSTIRIALLLSLGLSPAGVGADEGAVPAWFRDHMEFLARDGGRWIAGNADYRSDEEPYDEYGIEWRWGIGERSLTGRLFGLRDGEEAGTFWEFRMIWHPGEHTPLAYQFGGDGTFGVGPIDSVDTRTTGMEQEFFAPEGTSYRMGHEALETGPDTRTTTSFRIDADGNRVKGRTYAWRRDL